MISSVDMAAKERRRCSQTSQANAGTITDVKDRHANSAIIRIASAKYYNTSHLLEKYIGIMILHGSAPFVAPNSAKISPVHAESASDSVLILSNLLSMKVRVAGWGVWGVGSVGPTFQRSGATGNTT
jgi:hypothetical protein